VCVWPDCLRWRATAPVRRGGATSGPSAKVRSCITPTCSRRSRADASRARLVLAWCSWLRSAASLQARCRRLSKVRFAAFSQPPLPRYLAHTPRVCVTRAPPCRPSLQRLSVFKLLCCILDPSQMHHSRWALGSSATSSPPTAECTSSTASRRQGSNRKIGWSKGSISVCTEP
jgi:hypothetical protein